MGLFTSSTAEAQRKVLEGHLICSLLWDSICLISYLFLLGTQQAATLKFHVILIPLLPLEIDFIPLVDITVKFFSTLSNTPYSNLNLLFLFLTLLTMRVVSSSLGNYQVVCNCIYIFLCVFSHTFRGYHKF